MILDTSALSDFLQENPLIRQHATAAESFCIPVIVLGEYRYGLRLSKRRAVLEKKLTDLLKDVTILPVEEETADIYADLQTELKAAGTPIPENDLWIAALVRQYKRPLLSRDGHFDRVVGIRRLSW